MYPLDPEASGCESRHDVSPFVSIVIPVYNGAGTIRMCLDAILNQDLPREQYEVIVVDNNSTDNLAETVQGYPAKLVSERSCQSAYAARNTGIRQATGELVAFIDADCVAEPDWLRRLIEPFADETVGGVGGEIVDLQAINLVERFIQCCLPYRQCLPNDGRFLPGLITGNAAYRRQDLLDIGLFNTMFDGSDIDLSWRLQINTGRQIRFVPEAIVHHKHRSSVRRLFWWQYRLGYGEILMAALYRDLHDSLYNPGSQLKNMAKQIRALLTYPASFVRRLLPWVTNRRDLDPLYIARPMFFFVADGGLLLGRIKGLWATRFFTVDVSARVWEEPI
jgi:cellulose synthase/poly-beta-1,6-N-acetylglucosamine synthase-like glycosyltransferase